MFAHSSKNALIFKLYSEISHASQEVLNLLVSEFYGYLQTRWEELAKYERLCDMPEEAASFLAKQLDLQHTYPFITGLRP